MRNILLALSILLATYGVGIGATNKNLPGSITTSGNDKAVVQSIVDSLVGVGDTGFIACGIGATYCQTNAFNTLRNPLQYSGMPKASSVVTVNPDSISCSFMAMRKDADIASLNFGINLNVGTSTSPVWTTYGGAILSDTSTVALSKYTVTAPFSVARQFRPWTTVTTATDTLRVRFVECRSK